jgi:hypothetical protein
MIWHNDHPGISTFLNMYKGRARVLGLYEVDDALRPETESRLSPLAASPQPVWIIDKEAVGTMSALERMAAPGRGVVQEASVSTSVPRLSSSLTEPEALKAMFYFDTPDWRVQSLDVEMGLDGQPAIRLVEGGITPEARPGDILGVRLVWEALEPVSEEYQVFVRLVDPRGKPVSMQIGPPQNGLMPTTEWQPGQPVTDVHAFAIDADALPGDYHFVVGLHRLVDMNGMRTIDGRDEVTLGPIQVVL